MGNQHINKKQFINELMKLNSEINGETTQSLINCAPLAIIVLDPAGNVKVWNPAAVSIFGWSQKEALGEIIPFFAKNNPHEFYALRERVLKGEKIIDLEMSCQKKGGFPVDISASVAALYDKRGDLVGISVIATDITQRKIAEANLKSSKEYYRLIVECSPDYICHISLDDKIMSMNKNSCLINEFINSGESKEPSFVIPLAEHREAIKSAMARAKKGETISVQYKTVNKENQEIWWDSELTAIRNTSGAVDSILTITRDISGYKKIEERERVMTLGLRAIVEEADELIACTDMDTFFKKAIEFARSKLGLERCAIFIDDDGYMQGTYGTDRYGCTIDEHTQRFPKSKVWIQRSKFLGPQDPRWFTVDEPLYEWDGEKIVEIGRGWIAVTPIQSVRKSVGIFVNDTALSKSSLDVAKQEIVAVFCSLLGNIGERNRVEKEREILNKELLKSNKKLQQLAVRDSHTGLYNHRYFTDIIEAEFDRAARNNNPLSMLMLDIDYFKSINDVYGHSFGDLVLRQLAIQLKKIVRTYDIVTRFGGEEFIIISPATDRARALILAKRILNKVNVYNFGNKEHMVRVKLSIGVAAYPEDKVVNVRELIELVDKILCKVKEYGGNRAYSFVDMRKSKPIIMEENALNSDIKYLKEKIDRLTKRANQSLMEAVFAFAKKLQVKDHYSSEHAEMAAYYATEIAKALGLPRDQIECIRQASILYDLGKIGISDNILLKCAKLTKKEFERVKKHPQIGVDIIRPVQFLHSIVPLILYHHERWDGKGYPRGLKAEEIPIGARIIALVDVYQALISSRPYRQEVYSKEEVVKIIKENSGTHFDPAVVNTLLRILEKKRN